MVNTRLQAQRSVDDSKLNEYVWPITTRSRKRACEPVIVSTSVKRVKQVKRVRFIINEQTLKTTDRISPREVSQRPTEIKENVTWIRATATKSILKPAKGAVPSICDKEVRATRITRSRTVNGDRAEPKVMEKQSTRCFQPSAPFTFGVEMEVLVHVDPRPYISQLPKENQRPITAAAKVLSANCKNGGYEHLIRQSMAKTLRTAGFRVNNVESDIEHINKWTVGTDKTISTAAEYAASRGKLAVVGVELKTPALPFNKESLGQLLSVIYLLGLEYRITSNESCQLHVHVGIADAETGKQIPFTLSTCQNLATLSTAFEAQLDSLHPLRLLEDKYCKPLSSIFNGFDLTDMAAHIRRTNTLQSFTRLMGRNIDDRNYAVNFQNLRAAAQFGTVEFRQHVGCFVFEAIFYRVWLVVALTRWADKLDAARDLEHLLWCMGKGVDFSLRDLLRCLDVECAIIDFYERRGLYAHDFKEDC